MCTPQAAQRRGSGKVLVQPPKDSLEAIATEFFSSRSVRTWNSSFGTAAVEGHVAEFVDAEQVDAAVAGEGLGELFGVGIYTEGVAADGGPDPNMTISLDGSLQSLAEASTGSTPTALSTASGPWQPEGIRVPGVGARTSRRFRIMGR